MINVHADIYEWKSCNIIIITITWYYRILLKIIIFKRTIFERVTRVYFITVNFAKQSASTPYAFNIIIIVIITYTVCNGETYRKYDFYIFAFILISRSPFELQCWCINRPSIFGDVIIHVRLTRVDRINANYIAFYNLRPRIRRMSAEHASFVSIINMRRLSQFPLVFGSKKKRQISNTAISDPIGMFKNNNQFKWKSF